MKKLLFFCLLTTSLSYSQISYDFQKPLPPDGKQVYSFDNIYFGIYKNESSPFSYEVSKEGIFIISVAINSISRETIRESSKYTVRNNHIFGVLADEDSIPCILDGENYYFGVKNKVQIVGGSSKNKLLETAAGQYILNYEENGKYVPAFISVVGTNLSIRQFDYEANTKSFRKIKLYTSYSDGLEYITLDPTIEEWQKIKLAEIQGEPMVFVKM